MKSGIYRITNTSTFRSYVGSAVNILKRFTAHRRNLDAMTHPNKRLQNSWVKWGAQHFEFVVIELAEKELLISREQYWIDALDASVGGFNIRKIAGSNLGLKSSPETRAKLRAAALNLTSEQIAKRSAKLIGHSTSQETRKKISIAHLGKKQKPPSAAVRLRLSAAFKGKPRPVDVVEKISNSKRAYWEDRKSKLKDGERLGRGGVIISSELGVRFAPTPAEAAAFHRERAA